MTDILQEVMDAISGLQRVQAKLEGLEDQANRPIVSAVGSTQYFTCPCGTPVHFGDKFCRECGRRIRWDG